MSLVYGPCDITNLVYSNSLKLRTDIKVNKKKDERKFNDDLRLLMSEILYITRYVDYQDSKPIKIIYIGAAPGFHLVKLMKMFPFIIFDLYDDEELHPDLERYLIENENQVTMYREKFTLETCSRYEEALEDIYLITDNREVRFMKDPIFPKDSYYSEVKEQFQKEKEASYLQDMEFQKEVCKKLEPCNAFLRFRPPHFYEGMSPEPAIFEYFSGIVYLMIFNDYKSTESRIVVNDYVNDKFKWNYKDFQHRLNDFNAEVRESLLVNPFTNDSAPLPNQLGNKFETVMMIQLLIEYFKTIGYDNPRVTDILKFYTDFLVVETCSDIPGMLKECSIERVDDEIDADLYEEPVNYDEDNFY